MINQWDFVKRIAIEFNKKTSREGYFRAVLSGQDVRNLLGKRIQYFRKQRQLSQANLAEKADISIAFLSKIERGIKYPTSETISGIVNGLGVPLAELFQQDDTPTEQQDMFERFKNDLTETVIKSVETVYKAYEK